MAATWTLESRSPWYWERQASRVHGSRLVPRTDLACPIFVLDPAGRIPNLEKQWHRLSGVVPVSATSKARPTLRSILAVVGLMYGIDVLLHSQPVDAWRPPGSAPDAADITRITIGVSFLGLLASNSPSVGGSDPAQWYGRSMARLVSPVPHA
ncbi:hypothetical protein Plec18167_002945 [Paecilomyces lecythidis]|uniref:Uncharacterized protein n=1 Tax=Paecilomyces lecythidis TaxID=3004212 RepID=A0ABR3Y4A2_9EURO